MKRFGVVLALGLALAVPASALAASSASVGDSFSINSTLSVVVDKTSLNYGALNPGGISAAQSLTATSTSNVDAALQISGTDFSGPQVIPATVREFSDGGQFNPLPINFAVTGTAVIPLQFRINLSGQPAAKAGTYTGTIDFKIVATGS